MTSRIARLQAHAAVPCFNIGHRGARGFAPENTLPAFHKAVQLGCHMVELDVHVARDGTLIVHHDDDLVRCTDVTTRFPGRSTYQLSDFDAAQITALDAGSWFVRELALAPAQRAPFLRTLDAGELNAHLTPAELQTYASGALHVPTLSQVFEMLEASRLLVNVEIKSLPRMYPHIAARVLDCITHHGMESRTLVSSFDHEQLVAIRALSPSLATAVLTSDRLARPASYLELLDADAYHPSCHGENDSLGFNSVAGTVQRAGIAEVLGAGKGVHTWTCNDAAQMRELLAAGVTGIFTDYPNRLTAVTSQPVPSGA